MYETMEQEKKSALIISNIKKCLHGMVYTVSRMEIYLVGAGHGFPRSCVFSRFSYASKLDTERLNFNKKILQNRKNRHWIQQSGIYEQAVSPQVSSMRAILLLLHWRSRGDTQRASLQEICI